MRVHDVTIENFRGIERRTFRFCEPGTDTPRRLSVLIGPNGSGKTTVLDALHLAYEVVSNIRDPERRLRPNFNPADPTLRPDANLPIRINVRFSLQPGELEAIHDLQQKLGDSASAPPAQVYELKVRWPPKDGLTELGYIVEGSAPRGANTAFRGRALARVARSRRLATEAVFADVGGVLYLDQHRSVDLAVPSTRTAPEEELREHALSRDLLPWLELQSRLDQKWNVAEQGPSAWSRVQTRFAELAAPSTIDDMKAFDDGFDLRFKREGKYYYTAGLSYGEAQMLRFATNLTAFPALRSVILVDEAELHLHPAWQRKLLHFMRKGGGDDNQFIITTHSESIAGYLHPDEIVKLGALDEPG